MDSFFILYFIIISSFIKECNPLPFLFRETGGNADLFFSCGTFFFDNVQKEIKRGHEKDGESGDPRKLCKIRGIMIDAPEVTDYEL